MAILFGKLPAHGDFIARGLSDADTERLDDFLSASLSAAAMVDGFDDLYALAPVWRFVTNIGGEAVCGVLAPSIDRVGRQFPILAGVMAGEDAGLRIDACEAQLYQAFAEGLDADALFARLSATPEPQGAPPSSGWWLEDSERTVIVRVDGEWPVDVMTRMIEAARQMS
ncbi:MULTISPECIES: type VI secretion system-associated protein TagF [Asticcacaulis]|uniref:type VI secretion system-associated protein TagF n=1 Tax=Asticcacaulis TaxID=76890 RepID=UPI001AE4B550|nr:MULTISPECIES: type VI secretion system-associated protein TagF [Asticcacaulis]MBP2161043.1 type VI secretion system protein ImpM [Asticcacaulis solisilvae]MDR6802088.1 type VI secretion system protein ImpM [Asticcacaulis sp. BE141]